MWFVEKYSTIVLRSLIQNELSVFSKARTLFLSEFLKFYLIESPAVHQPIIMDKVKASPVQQQQQISRLLNRRKSLDPVRLREVRQELFGAEDFIAKVGHIAQNVQNVDRYDKHS